MKLGRITIHIECNAIAHNINCSNYLIAGMGYSPYGNGSS